MRGYVQRGGNNRPRSGSCVLFECGLPGRYDRIHEQFYRCNRIYLGFWRWVGNQQRHVSNAYLSWSRNLRGYIDSHRQWNLRGHYYHERNGKSITNGNGYERDHLRGRLGQHDSRWGVNLYMEYGLCRRHAYG